MVRPPYATCVRLAYIAAERWAELDASYISVNLLRLPTHRFFNAVFAWCVERIDPEKREEWEMQLNEPFYNDTPTQAQLEREAEGFMALMGSNMPGMG